MTQLSSKSKAYIAARNLLGDHRKLFDSLGDALALVLKIYQTEAFPVDFPCIAAGIGGIDFTESGESIPPISDWPTIYGQAGVQVCVSFLGVRGIKEGDKEVNGARAFVIYPTHPVDAIRADETGMAWLWKIVEKETSHVALRGLRNVNPALGNDALFQAAQNMPLSVGDYVEESAREALDTSAFDATWKQFKKLLSESAATAALVPQLPQKAEVIRAIRSKTYATEHYGDLEAIGAFEFIARRMAAIVDLLHKQAVDSGTDFDLDSAELRGWLANRDKFVYEAPRKVVTDLSTVDFAAFLGGFDGESAAASVAEQNAAQ